MAIFVYTDADFIVVATELSTYVRMATLNYEAELLDATAMQGTSTRARRAGLLNWSMDIEFNQDFAASQVDATLFPLLGAAPFAVFLQPTSAAISATNPSFTGNVVLNKYGPLEGQVGALAIVKATFSSAGPLTRDITP